MQAFRLAWPMNARDGKDDKGTAPWGRYLIKLRELLLIERENEKQTREKRKREAKRREYRIGKETVREQEDTNGNKKEQEQNRTRTR